MVLYRHYGTHDRCFTTPTVDRRPMYNLDGVALSGSLLASLLNEAASPYAGSEPRKVRKNACLKKKKVCAGKTGTERERERRVVTEKKGAT